MRKRVRVVVEDMPQGHVGVRKRRSQASKEKHEGCVRRELLRLSPSLSSQVDARAVTGYNSVLCYAA